MKQLVWMGALVLTACGEPREEAILALTGSASEGEGVYADHCEVCHGDDGTGTATGADLTERVPGMSDQALIETILYGSGDMAGLGSRITDQEVADVTAYVTETFDP